LEMLARHALKREYPKQRSTSATAPLQPQVIAMVEEASGRFARLAAEWVRVGYVQSNFNSDNCLVGGVTVDYGPFGFIEKYNPKWGMWIGSGEHFSFLNQPAAAERNFRMFANSLEALLDADGKRQLRAIIHDHSRRSEEAVAAMWALKLGFGAKSTPATAAVWSALDNLMVQQPTDYTILYRQLSDVLDAAATSASGSSDNVDDASSVAPLVRAFQEPLTAPMEGRWAAWVRRWLSALEAQGSEASAAAAAMRRVNPKFVPREWMLVEAYTAAERGDHAPLHTLHTLLKRPYEEQFEYGRYYAPAPKGAEQQGGLGFMS